MSRMPYFRCRLLLILLCLGALWSANAVVIFSDGFENGLDPSWLVGDDNPDDVPCYWGVVDSGFGGEGTHGGTNKVYCAGFGYGGSYAAPRYRNSMSGYMLRSIDLTGYTNATLSFWTKIPSGQNNSDFAWVYMDDQLIWFRDNAMSAWTQTNFSLNGFVNGIHTLKFLFTTDTSVTNEGWYIDDISITDDYTPGPPPTNDYYTNAQVLTGAAGVMRGNNAEATAEPGEPAGYNTVWYQWTPTTNGPVMFTTGGSGFDTILCVYTGTAISNLVSIGCDNNSGTNGSSLLTFNATNGTTYSISVRGNNGERGFIALSWMQTNGLGQALLPDLTMWADSSRNYLYGWILDRTTIPNHTLLRPSTAEPNIGTGPLELRGSSSAPGVFQRIYYSGGGFYDRYAGTFTFHPGHGHLHFDDWLVLNLRAALSNDVVGPLVAAGAKMSFAIIDVAHYNASLPGSPSAAVYTGGLTQGMSVGWADVYGQNLAGQWIDITGVPPGRYWLEAVVDPDNSILESNKSNNVARILITLGAPPNDNLTNATVISGNTAGIVDYNIDATKETGEPNHAGNAGGHSLWYQWTAPSNMTVTVTTEGSSFNTLLGVYTGSAVNALTTVVSDDDVNFTTLTSTVTFPAVKNTNYWIAVDGFNATNGRIELNFNPAWNDDFAEAVVLTNYSGTTSGSNRGATKQSGEPNHAAFPTSNSIWYSWKPGTNCLITFDTIESGFNAVLAVYTGNAVNALTLVTNDNGSVGNLGWSRLTFNAKGGTNYSIAIAGTNGNGGITKLNWNIAGPPVIIMQPAATNRVSGSVTSFTVAVSGAQPFSYQWQHAGVNESDSKFYSGSTTPTFTINGVSPGDAGTYSVIITNAFGAVTSAPAALIVLDNPRVVFIDPVSGQIGGIVAVPIQFQATGNEHSASFSLLYDPVCMGDPFITNSPVGAGFASDYSLVSTGRFGAMFTMPGSQVIPSGEQQLALILFSAANGLTNNTSTSIGFGDSPVARLVTDTNGLSLTTLFAAGTITLQVIHAIESGQRLADGRFQIVLNGMSGKNYALEASTNLVTWTSLMTNTADMTGLLPFIDNGSTNKQMRFYRARLVQ